MNHQVTAADWVEAIASKSSLTASTVQETLDRYGIEPQSTLPRRKHLRIRSVRLQGVKEGTAENGPFDSTFRFGQGLWAILSDQNSRGKSTLLGVIQGGIRGDLPDRVKPDIWRWLSHVEVVFQANEIEHRLVITKKSGDERREGQAQFAREQGETWFPLYEGPIGDPLERAMEDAMLAEFGFARFHAHNDRDGSHTHGWPAIAAALFVNGPGKAIFGEVLIDAIPLRLLQMFIGLPWVSTYTAASTALKRVRASKSERAPLNKGFLDRLAARLQKVEEALEEKRGQVRPDIDRSAIRAQILVLDGELIALRKAADRARDQSANQDRQWQGAKTLLAETRRSLQQLTDDRNAGLVFRSLRPVCCPSCDAGIDLNRHESASKKAICALCGTEDRDQDDESGIRISDLEDDVKDATSQVDLLKDAFDQAKDNEKAAVQAVSAAAGRLKSLENDLSSEAEADLELEIRGLEAQKTELQSLIAGEDEVEPDQGDKTADDEAVLKAAEEITKELYDGLARDILREVSEEITRLSKLFGVQNLESMEWGTGGALRIIQGATQTSFGKLSPGENLRVRIAAALAIIEVSRRRMYGRHPGLLVLDSPGSQEMSAGDFATLLSSVQEAIENADDIQIIVGAVARPQLLQVVPGDHTTHAQDQRFLF